jgi:hypothetical protein
LRLEQGIVVDAVVGDGDPDSVQVELDDVLRREQIAALWPEGSTCGSARLIWLPGGALAGRQVPRPVTYSFQP